MNTSVLSYPFKFGGVDGLKIVELILKQKMSQNPIFLTEVLKCGVILKYEYV